jgi:ectoine hydroxylase-related dioxygenase (phytanoyl-CoA dioxygenase family)
MATAAGQNGAAGITAEQKQQFLTDGYCVVPRLFTRPECEELINHQTDLATGAKTLPRRADLTSFGEFDGGGEGWKRSMNQHMIDPYIEKWVVHPKLAQPLHDCLNEPAEAIQSMYFWKSQAWPASDGTYHQGARPCTNYRPRNAVRPHQAACAHSPLASCVLRLAPVVGAADQTPIPGVISAWIALVDIGPTQGPLKVQPGSHLRRAVWHEDTVPEAGAGTTAEDESGNVRHRLQLEVFEENRRAGLSEVTLDRLRQGDCVLFHGRLLHTGSKPADLGAFRHVLASHYIPKSYGFWPPLWVTRPIAAADGGGGDPEALVRAHPRVTFDARWRYAPEPLADLAQREHRANGQPARGWITELPASVRAVPGRLSALSVFL